MKYSIANFIVHLTEAAAYHLWHQLTPLLCKYSPQFIEVVLVINKFLLSCFMLERNNEMAVFLQENKLNCFNVCYVKNVPYNATACILQYCLWCTDFDCLYTDMRCSVKRRQANKCMKYQLYRYLIKVLPLP